jgi:hypothetical protein
MIAEHTRDVKTDIMRRWGIWFFMNECKHCECKKENHTNVAVKWFLKNEFIPLYHVQIWHVFTFGKPRMIQSPSSNLGCMTVFDMRLRLTFVIWLAAVYRFRQTLRSCSVKNLKGLRNTHTCLFSQSNWLTHLLLLNLNNPCVAI